MREMIDMGRIIEWRVLLSSEKQPDPVFQTERIRNRANKDTGGCQYRRDACNYLLWKIQVLKDLTCHHHIEALIGKWPVRRKIKRTNLNAKPSLGILERICINIDTKNCIASIVRLSENSIPTADIEHVLASTNNFPKELTARILEYRVTKTMSFSMMFSIDGSQGHSHARMILYIAA